MALHVFSSSFDRPQVQTMKRYATKRCEPPQRRNAERSRFRKHVPSDPFYDHLRHWNDMVQVHGRLTAYSQNPDVKRAGEWQGSMQQMYQRGTLSPKHMEALNATDGWTWMHPDPFEDHLRHWVVMNQWYDGKPSVYSHDPDVKRAGRWQARMRRAYQQGHLSYDRIRILNDTPGWTWDENNLFFSFEARDEDSNRFERQFRRVEGGRKGCNRRRSS